MSDKMSVLCCGCLVSPLFFCRLPCVLGLMFLFRCEKELSAWSEGMWVVCQISSSSYQVTLPFYNLARKTNAGSGIPKSRIEWERAWQDRTGRGGTGRDGTGRDGQDGRGQNGIGQDKTRLDWTVQRMYSTKQLCRDSKEDSSLEFFFH
jgi:hypothetical protein